LLSHDTGNGIDAACCEPSALKDCTQCLLFADAQVLAVQVLVWDVVLPGDYFALVWDLIMLLVILYLCIILPYSVAFAMDFVSYSLVAHS
jgi:hypothetical protein